MIFLLPCGSNRRLQGVEIPSARPRNASVTTKSCGKAAARFSWAKRGETAAALQPMFGFIKRNCRACANSTAQRINSPLANGTGRRPKRSLAEEKRGNKGNKDG